MQMKTPRFHDAHRGSEAIGSQRLPGISPVERGFKSVRLFRLQSAQILFASNFRRFLTVCWFWAARSGGTRRDMAAEGFLGICDEVGRQTRLFFC